MGGTSSMGQPMGMGQSMSAYAPPPFAPVPYYGQQMPWMMPQGLPPAMPQAPQPGMAGLMQTPAPMPGFPRGPGHHGYRPNPRHGPNAYILPKLGRPAPQ